MLFRSDGVVLPFRDAVAVEHLGREGHGHQAHGHDQQRDEDAEVVGRDDAEARLIPAPEKHEGRATGSQADEGQQAHETALALPAPGLGQHDEQRASRLVVIGEKGLDRDAIAAALLEP